MDPNENNDENTIVPTSTAERASITFILITTGIQLGIAMLTYPFLPERIPIHWNIDGQIDRYGDKFWAIFLWPLLSIGLFLIIRFAIWLGPQLGSDNRRLNLSLVGRLHIGTSLLCLAMQLVVIAAGFRLPINITFVTNTLLGVIFIFVGNYLGKVRRNFWMGIRTPWTLMSDVSWERTHRMGSWLFVAVGIIILILEFVPGITTRALLPFVILPAIAWLVLYSYIVYRQEQQHSH